MAIQQDTDDSSWPEAKLINEHVEVIRIMFLCMKGLSVLMITLTTVVLLGGFVSVLEMKDFWSLTVITSIQLPGLVSICHFIPPLICLLDKLYLNFTLYDSLCFFDSSFR